MTDERRVMGIDFGEARIGVALSDPTRTLASPLCVVATKDKGAQIRDVAALVAEHEVALIVVGMPFLLDGSAGTMVEIAGKFADKLGAVTGVPVVRRDERLTSVEAEDRLREGGWRGPGAGGSRHKQKGKKAKRAARDGKGRIDMAAATVLLQEYLDSGAWRDEA